MTKDVNVVRWAILRKLMKMQQAFDTLETAQAHRALSQAMYQGRKAVILTGPEIRSQVALGREWDGKKRVVTLPSRYDVLVQEEIIDEKMNYIDVEPYEESLVGPNSIDLRLGNELLVYDAGIKRHQYCNYHHRKYSEWEAYAEVERRRSENPGEDRIVILEPPPLVNTWYANDDDLLTKNWPVLDCPIPANSVLDLKAENRTHKLEIPEEGLILWPGILYLGRTIEVIGSNAFVPIVEGRSSVGRLGVHVHVTAGFCDLGFRGSITLEIHALHPIRIYPNLPICQAYFLEPRGEIELYKGRYQGQVDPTASRFGQDL